MDGLDLGTVTIDEAGVTALFANGFTRVRVERTGWARCRLSAWMGDGNDLEFRRLGRKVGAPWWQLLFDVFRVPFPRSDVWDITAEQWGDR